jgi:predicted methyltransferase
MKDTQLYLLLDVIYRNSSVKKLIRQGISFDNIAEMTSSAINSEILYYINEKVALTLKGLEIYKQLEKKYKKTNKNEWIEKDFKSQIPKLDKNSIFLPQQSELTF